MSARASTSLTAAGCLEDGRPHSGDSPAAGQRGRVSAVDRYLPRMTTRSGTQRARGSLTPTVAVLNCARRVAKYLATCGYPKMSVVGVRISPEFRGPRAPEAEGR